MSHFKLLLFAFSVACLPHSVQSQTATNRLVYINGIQNTFADALATRNNIAGILKDSTNRSALAKRNFDVKLVWNPEGWYESPVDIPNCGTPCQDIFELLVLKSSEEDYSSDFTKILAPHNLPSTIDQTAANKVKPYADSLVIGDNSALTSHFITADRMAAMKKALDSLTVWMNRATPTIVIAHSQGNILANLAWATVAASIGQDVRKKARVINIANTSRFSVNNLNLTHDDDNVLAALQVAPSVQAYNFTRTTALHSGQDNFELTPPTFKAPAAGFSCAWPTCKHWMDTYISADDIPTGLVDHHVIFTLNKTAFKDRFEDLIYAAAISLDRETLISIQPGPAQGKDIWTTNVYSFAPGGGGPGGGLNDDTLRVGGWFDEYRSLLQFDLTSATLPQQPTSVVLRLFDGTAQGQSTTAMTLFRITAFWDWTTQGTGSDLLRLWWADQPSAVQVGATSSRSSILPAPVVGQSYDIDITDLYLFWKANPTQNFGLELRPTFTDNRWNIFYSSDYLADPTKRPQLIITP